MLSTNRLPTWSLPLLVFAMAMAVRVSVIWFWQFDGLYGQDAFAYYDRSVDLAHRLVHGWSALPPFFWPHGYPILGAAAILAVGHGPVGPQLVNVVFGSLLALLVFFFARDLDRASAAAEAVASHLPAGGRVLAFAITPAIDHYTRADVFELFSLDEPTLAWASDGAEPTLVVVDRGNVETQWADRPPGRNLRWLERERRLGLVEEIGPWSISRVGPAEPVAEGFR